MKTCHICGVHLRDKYNLERHLERNHESDEMNDSESSERYPDIFDESGSEADSDTSSEDSGDESDDEESDADQDDQPVTDNLIDNIFDSLEESRQEVIDALMRDGRDAVQANREAYQTLLPKYRKAFREKLSDTFVRIVQLRHEPINKGIMDTANDLKLDGTDREESIRSAISKRKHKLNQYIPDEEEEDSDDIDMDQEEEDID